jgi:hypothetical protein
MRVSAVPVAGSRDAHAIMRAAGSATSGRMHIKIISSLRRPSQSKREQKAEADAGAREVGDGISQRTAHQRMPIIDTRQIFNEEFAQRSPSQGDALLSSRTTTARIQGKLWRRAAAASVLIN